MPSCNVNVRSLGDIMLSREEWGILAATGNLAFKSPYKDQRPYYLIASINGGKAEFIDMDNLVGNPYYWSSRKLDKFDVEPNLERVLESHMHGNGRKIFIIRLSRFGLDAFDVSDVEEAVIDQKKSRIDAQIADLQRQRTELDLKSKSGKI